MCGWCESLASPRLPHRCHCCVFAIDLGTSALEPGLRRSEARATGSRSGQMPLECMFVRVLSKAYEDTGFNVVELNK